MIYMFIKMSSKWYGVEYSDFATAEENAMGHIGQGSIVVFSDDIETFADEMNIEQDEIEMT